MRIVRTVSVGVFAVLVIATSVREARAQSCNLSTSCTSQSGTAATVLGTGTTGTGVEGTSNSGTGVSGTSTSGDGVYGSTSGNTNGVAGVYGTSSATSAGIGVSGVATGASSVGVEGEGGKYGVFAYTAVNGGIGVDGHSEGTAGYGMYASCDGACATSGGVALWAAGAAGGSTSWNSSDARLKKDVNDATYGLDQVLKLRPVTFLWKNEQLGTGTQFGLIAQEVEKVFPEVVRLGPDGNLALNYVQLVPVLVRAVQQQQAEIAKLENEPTTSVSSLSQGSAAGLALGFLGLGVFSTRRKRKEEHKENAVPASPSSP